MGLFNYIFLLKTPQIAYLLLILMDKIEFRIAFGKSIEKYRKKLGLSYRELAQKCDVDHSNISKIEKGEVDLRISTIQELAKGLKIHPKELFDIEFDFKKFYSGLDE